MANLNNSYKQFQDKMIKINEFLGISEIEPNRLLVDAILNVRAEDLKNKTSIELNEMTIFLAQYCIFLQNHENKCKIIQKWCNKNISIFSNDNKYKINGWLNEIEIRLQKLSYLVRRIENFVQCISNLSKIKQWNRNIE